MNDGDLTILSPAAAAVTLAALWIGEAVLPAFVEHEGFRRSVRWRNLCLAGLNIVVAASFAGLTLLVTTWSEQLGAGILHQLGLLMPGSTAIAIILVCLAFLLLDLWGYLFHVLAHQLPLLWRFHALHHNARHFEVTLALRFHAVEIAVQGLLSLPVYFLIGVGIQEILIYQLVLVPMAFFHHCNVRMPQGIDRMLSWVLVTPGMHVIHHSKWVRETDSNYAPVFSIWDRAFGSYRWRDRPETVEVGLAGFNDEQVDTLRGMLKTGFDGSPAGPGNPPADELIPVRLRDGDGRSAEVTSTKPT